MAISKRSVKITCIVITILFLASCSKSYNFNADLSSQENGDVFEFNLMLSSEEEGKYKFYSQIDESLILGSLTHEIKNKNSLIVPKRNSEVVNVSLSPNEGHKIKFSAVRTVLDDGSILLDFGALGSIQGSPDEEVDLGAIVFPDYNFYDSIDGISSNSIKVRL